jgi:hypothetical protein
MVTRQLVNSAARTIVGRTMMRVSFRAGCAAVILLTTPAAAQRSGRRVVRATDIAAAGWHRLGDIVSALMPGNVASVDGFNAALTASRAPFAGLSAAGSPQWIVRVDGQRIPMAIDGMWILDALPVAMVQVDSVCVASGSSIVDGAPSLLGTLDVYTRRPPHGVSAVGDYQHGDESGDPGPYRYTPLATPNVEKLGPFTSGAAAYASSLWSIDGAARYSSLNITDTSIARRFPATFGQLQSDVNASGGSGILSTSLFDGAQTTIGGRGRFTGLLWVPSRHREESVHVIATQAGSSGDGRLGGAHLRYAATGTLLNVNDLRSPLPISIDRNVVMNDFFGELTLPGSQVAVGAGGSWWAKSQVNHGSPLEDRTAARVWLDLFKAPSEHGLTASVAFGDGVIAPSVVGWLGASLANRYSLVTTISSIERLPSADGVWATETPMTAADRADQGVLTKYNTRFDELRVELSDTALGLTPSLDLRLLNASNWRLDPTLAPGGQQFQTLVIGTGIETRLAARTRASLRGEAAATHSRSVAMQSAMKSTPAASLRADVSRVVMTNLMLAMSGKLTTATSWPSESIFDETPDLPSLRRIDLSANKPFWHDHARAQLVIRNLFATDERYHPVGASWNFRTHLAITIALPPYGSMSNNR